jgi:hypothetical protein
MPRTLLTRRLRRRGLVVLAVVACALGLSGLAQPAVQAADGGGTATGSTDALPGTHPFFPGDDDMAGEDAHSRAHSPSRIPGAHVPTPTTLPVAAAPGALSAGGLSFQDQRDADNGNAFNDEPPDQALCASPSQVIEGVNEIFATYDHSGTKTSGNETYDMFFNGVLAIDRSPDADPDHIFGPFMSDPKCYWDPGTQRFYMVMLELGLDGATGDFNGDSWTDIAVTKTSTATTDPGGWWMYQIDERNDGHPDTTTGVTGQTLPTHPGCPCLGDQPLIGADANGFFITTNEFSIDGPNFNGAQEYAFDKVGLANGTLRVQRFDAVDPPLAEGVAYSVQPATSPAAKDWSTANHGTEFALSALEFTGGLDNRIATWAFTNTASLATATPDVHLSQVVVGSEVYGAPPKVAQKPGPYPLGQALKEKLAFLESNDDRMNQTVYAGGQLWSGVNSAVRTENGPTTTGIAYFVVQPTAPTTNTDSVTATMANQGYVAVNRNSVFFPSIGVTAGGTKAAMVFTLAGPGIYPSTAFVRLNSGGAVLGPVSVYAAGTKPYDGASAYAAFGGGGVARWGDYSAAVASGDTIWVAAEWVPGDFGFPPYQANWGTAIGAV